MISKIVITAMRISRKMKALVTMACSRSLLSFLWRSRQIKIINQRPPSRAGIGRTFIQASEMEMIAIKRKM